MPFFKTKQSIQEQINSAFEARHKAKTEKRAQAEEEAINNIQVTHNNELKEILKVDKSQDLRDIILESIAADFYTGAKLPKLVDKFPLSKQSYDALVDEYVEKDKQVQDYITALRTVNDEELSDAQTAGIKTILKAAAKSVTVTSKTELKKSVETIFNHIKTAMETLIEQATKVYSPEKIAKDKTLYICKEVSRQCENKPAKIFSLKPVIIYHNVISIEIEGTVEVKEEAPNQPGIVTENKGGNATPTYEYILLNNDGTIGNCTTTYNITYENGDYKEIKSKSNMFGFLGQGGRKSRKSSKKARRKTSRK
jgi:hypothetical protein